MFMVMVHLIHLSFMELRIKGRPPLDGSFSMYIRNTKERPAQLKDRSFFYVLTIFLLCILCILVNIFNWIVLKTF